MAVWRRQPTDTVLVHSDQGSQYGSDDWARFCREHHLQPSMSCRGNSWDNAVAESFFSKPQVGRAVTRTRRHDHPGGVSREVFERATRLAVYGTGESALRLRGGLWHVRGKWLLGGCDGECV